MKHPGRILHIANIVTHQRGHFPIILGLAVPNIKSPAVDQTDHGSPDQDFEAVHAVLVDRCGSLSQGRQSANLLITAVYEQSIKHTYRHADIYNSCLNNKPICSIIVTSGGEMGHEADGPADEKGLGKSKHHHSYSRYDCRQKWCQNAAQENPGQGGRTLGFCCEIGLETIRITLEDLIDTNLSGSMLAE